MKIPILERMGIFCHKDWLPAAAAAVSTAAPAIAAVSAAARPSIAAKSAAAAAVRSAAFSTRSGFIDRQSASLKFFPVESGDGCLPFTSFWHFHETEPARLAREFIFNNRSRADLPVRLESLTDVVFRRIE